MQFEILQWTRLNIVFIVFRFIIFFITLSQNTRPDKDSYFKHQFLWKNLKIKTFIYQNYKQTVRLLSTLVIVYEIIMSGQIRDKYQKFKSGVF